VAAPIDAAASANILSFGSDAQALSDQGVMIDQGIVADANAESVQDSAIEQGNDTVDDGGAAAGTTDTGTAATGTADAGSAATGTTDDGGGLLPNGTSTDGIVPEDGLTGGSLPDVGALPTDPAAALGGDLLNVNVDLDADADVAAPINGAVAANANVAAPIDAAVAANIGSIDSQAYAVSDQDALITQHIEGEANASADQQSDLEQ
jgi:hypothetical protein